MKTHDRNNFVEYFSAAAEIPVPNNMIVRCLSELHLGILTAGEICAAEIFGIVFSHGLQEKRSTESAR